MSFNYTFGNQNADNERRELRAVQGSDGSLMVQERQGGGEKEGQQREAQGGNISGDDDEQENWAETGMAFAISYLTLGLA